MNKKIPIAAAVAVVLVAAVWGWLRFGQSEAEQLRISGNLEVDEVAVAFQLPGRVVARLVSEGEPVTAGQLVARLDDAELQREVAIRRAELAGADAALAEMLAGFRQEEIATAKAAVEAAAAEAERVESDYRRQAALRRDDVIAERELEGATAARIGARSRLEEARQQLALLERGPRREQIDQARARVEQLEQAVAALETRLSWATLHAPFDGVVLEENVEPGEVVAAGAPVITTANLARLWVRGYVPETELPHVRLGQRVSVLVDGVADPLPGRISFIASEAEFTPKQVETEKERVKLVYRVKVEVPNGRGLLKPGMPADVWVPMRQAGGADE